MIRRFAVVLVSVVIVACGTSEPTPPTPPTPTPTPTDVHAHTAPHGGALVELGEHFAFLEVVLDGDAGRVTVYVLDGEAEKAVRITQPTLNLTFEAPTALAGHNLVLAAKANTLTGETVGDTSEFVMTAPALKGHTTFTARIGEVTVKGQAFKDLTASK